MNSLLRDTLRSTVCMELFLHVFHFTSLQHTSTNVRQSYNIQLARSLLWKTTTTLLNLQPSQRCHTFHLSLPSIISLMTMSRMIMKHHSYLDLSLRLFAGRRSMRQLVNQHPRGCPGGTHSHPRHRYHRNFPHHRLTFIRPSRTTSRIANGQHIR